MTRAIALALGCALAALALGCGKYGAPVRYRPMPAAGAAVVGTGTAPAAGQSAPGESGPAQATPAADEEAPAATATPVPAEPRDPLLEPAPSWQP